MKNQKHSNETKDAGIKKAREILVVVLRAERNVSETYTLQLVSIFNPKIFQKSKISSKTFKKSKAIKNLFKDYKLIKSWKQPLNLERILCKSKFSSKPKIFEVKNAMNYAFVVTVF